jgi:hypothetical protein
MKNNTIKSTSINSMMIASISGLSFIIGLFFVLFTGATYWGEHLKKQMNIYVYLDDSLSVNEIKSTISRFTVVLNIGLSSKGKLLLAFITLVTILRWLSITPLGVPVVPDV